MKTQIMNFVNRMCKYIPTRKAKRLTKKYTRKLLGIKDYSLYSGERQTATDLEEIRKDHIERYQMAVDFLKKHGQKTEILNGYDVFCGIGYGSFMLSNHLKNAKIISIDGSQEAINLAQQFYQTGNITYRQLFFPFELTEEHADFFVSLESLEHIKNDDLFLKLIQRTLKPGGILILSIPNAEKWKLEINANHFHYRHYKPDELIEKLNTLHFELVQLYGQDIYKMDSSGKMKESLDHHDMELKLDYRGQCCIYIFRKIM